MLKTTRCWSSNWSNITPLSFNSSFERAILKKRLKLAWNCLIWAQSMTLSEIKCLSSDLQFQTLCFKQLPWEFYLLKEEGSTFKTFSSLLKINSRKSHRTFWLQLRSLWSSIRWSTKFRWWFSFQRTLLLCLKSCLEWRLHRSFMHI